MSDTVAKLIAAEEVVEVSILVEKWIDSMKAEIVKLRTENKVLKQSAVSILIERIEAGERKIIKRFVSDSIKASGVLGFITDVKELNKLSVGKEYKEWLLKSLLISFQLVINEMPVKEYKLIQYEADRAELELNHFIKNFLGYSRGQLLKAADNDYSKLRTAKDAITKAYISIKPRYFTGDLQIIDEEGDISYYTINDHIEFNVAPATFKNKSGEVVHYMSGDVVIHDGDEPLILYISGGINDTIYQTKVKNINKTMYSFILSIDTQSMTFTGILTKLK
jgi:hypothetical protein